MWTLWALLSSAQSAESQHAVVGADGVWRWVQSPADVPAALAAAERAVERAREPLRPDLFDPSEFDLPIDLNPRVRGWIDHFTGPGRRTFSEWLARGARYQPMMRRALADAGLPLDLVYLPMIESGYDPRARSRTAATGLWQFVGSTGEAQGLRMDAWIDERMDPEQSLHAALDYLAQLHAQFGDWRLALAAYNAGPGAVKRAISRAHTRNYWKLVERDQFSAETDDYVAKIMAAAIIGKHPEWHGFVDVPLRPELVYDVVAVNEGLTLDALASRADLNANELRSLNPALRRAATPPVRCEVRVPVGTAERVLAALAHADERRTAPGPTTVAASP